MKGYVYILTNPSMPGIVKIGRTTRSVHGRAGELFQTGVPTPFEVAHYRLSPDCVDLERTIHEELAGYRVGSDREFFKCDKDKAISVLKALAWFQVQGWLSEFFPDCVLTVDRYFVDPAALYEACKDTGVKPEDLAASIMHLAPDAINHAVSTQRLKAAGARELLNEPLSGGLVN